VSDHLVLIPVFDEAPTIGAVVAAARQHGPVLVVDDGSGDDSAVRAAAAGAEVVRLDRRGGKGAALRRGFAEALARGARAVVTLDGDGQHDPAEIPRLLAAAGGDALVIGCRLPADGARVPTMPASRLHALRVAGFFIGWIGGTTVRDSQSGFRVYPAPLLAEALLRRGGFVFESEVLLRAAASGFALREVPLRAAPAAGRASRFHPVRDGVAVGGFITGQALRFWARELFAVAAALVRPFTTERRRARHRELAVWVAPYEGAPGAWATAVAVFAMHRIADTWRVWWAEPRAVRMRQAAAATVLSPVLLAAAALQPLARRAGLDLVGPLVDLFYAPERLQPLARPGVAALAPPAVEIEAAAPRTAAAEVAAPRAAAPGARR